MQKPKSKLQKKKNLPNSTYWKKKALEKWAEYIHQQKYCSICGKSNTKLEAHHLISKKVKQFRNDIQNGILLCSYCHKWNPVCSPHAGALGFAEWLINNMPEKYDWWQENKEKITMFSATSTYKEDYEKLKELLKS